LLIHYLQHVPFEGLGSIAEWANAKRCPIAATRLYASEPLPDPAAFDALVVLGGPMGVGDEPEHPWLRAEKRFLAQVIERQVPVLGICLGAQLLAEVLGKLTDIFDTPVPDEVLSQLATSAARASNRSPAGAFSGRLARSLAGMSPSAAREEVALFFALKGIRSKWRYLFSLLFPSSEFMRLRYGLSSRSQLGFCYLRRTAHVVREGCKGILCLFSHAFYPFR